MAEAEGLLLADEEDVGQIGDAEALFQHLLLAGSGKFCFQLGAAVKVVLDDVLIAAHDDKDVGDAGADSLLHQILDGGFVHEGEHSFGHRLGGRQHRVPRPAAGMTALVIFFMIQTPLVYSLG